MAILFPAVQIEMGEVADPDSFGGWWRACNSQADEGWRTREMRDLAKDSKDENTQRGIEKKRLLTVFWQKVA